MTIRSVCLAVCRVLTVPILIACGIASADDPPQSYKDAEQVWQKSRAKPEYQAYATDFAALSNAFHIDERGGCYSLGAGPVNLMLLVSQADAKGVSTIERVFYDTNNAKARCFSNSYLGLPAKQPPFLPFVLQLRME